jgi:hypothetical protein
MRHIVKVLIGIMLYLVLAETADAQLRDRLRNRVQQAAEDRMEERIGRELEKAAERMVDHAWESIFGDGIIGENGERRTLPFTLNSNVTMEESYHFNIVTSMEIAMTDADGNSEPPLTMKMHFHENELYTGTSFAGEEMDLDDGEVFIIYDLKNSAMVMLMENEDGKFSFAYDWSHLLEPEGEQVRGDEPEEFENWEGFTQIGSKSILGYHAEGYELRDDESVTEIWVTRDAAYGMVNMFQAHANAKKLQDTFPENYPHGMLMEVTIEEPESGEKTVMRVTDIQKNANVTYVMNDYPVFGLGVWK